VPSVNYQTYKNLVKQNWVDGKIEESKKAMLGNLRKTLGVSDEEHMQVVAELSSSLPSSGSGETETPDADPSRYHGHDDEFQVQGYASEPGTDEPEPKEEEQPQDTGPQETQDTGTTPAELGIKRVSPAPAEPTPDTGTDVPEGDLSPEKLLELGKDAFRKGEYRKAFDLCDKVLKETPNHSQALFFKKRAKTKMDETGEGPTATQQESADPMLSHIQQTSTEATEAAGSSANPKCLSCRDSGTCSWCKSSGVCWMCHGSGTCNTCKSTGIVDGETCNKCKGSGKCDSCLGSGKCYWCKGSGKCHKCQK
jgi:hypothetical protein